MNNTKFLNKIIIRVNVELVKYFNNLAFSDKIIYLNKDK